MKRIWIFDLEVFPQIFCGTFLDKDSKEKRVFIISNTKDERQELFNFLNTEVQGLVGFNNLNYDSQIIEYLYRHPQATCLDLRQYSDVIISEQENRRPDVPEWKLKIPHLDLFKALSLSSSAKRTSLKWCEYMLDLDNIEDMPSQGDGNNWEEQVLSYNLNDVIATKKLYEKYHYEIDLRKTLTQREDISLINCTEPDLAKRLFGKYLSKAMNIPLNDLKAMSTNRDIVNIKDIIFPYIQFSTDKFKLVKESFEKLQLRENEKAEYTINHYGIDIHFGLGGLKYVVSL